MEFQLQTVFRVRQASPWSCVIQGPRGLEVRVPIGNLFKRARFEIDGRRYAIERHGNWLWCRFALVDTQDRTILAKTNRGGAFKSIHRLYGKNFRASLVPASDRGMRLYEGDRERGLTWRPEDGLLEAVGLEWLELPVAVFFVWLSVRHHGYLAREAA